jgi:hypothetical protein
VPGRFGDTVTIIHVVCEGVELGVTTLRAKCWAYEKIELIPEVSWAFAFAYVSLQETPNEAHIASIHICDLRFGLSTTVDYVHS